MAFTNDMLIEVKRSYAVRHHLPSLLTNTSEIILVSTWSRLEFACFARSLVWKFEAIVTVANKENVWERFYNLVVKAEFGSCSNQLVIFSQVEGTE